MDRSEGEKPKNRKEVLFRAQVGGKPCVAEGAERDNAVFAGSGFLFFLLRIKERIHGKTGKKAPPFRG